MTDLRDEFNKFLENDSRFKKLDTAVNLIKRSYPFIETWFKQSHAGMGLGAKNLMLDISKFLKELESE